MDLQTGIGLFVGGGALALIGTLLTMRDGRQKRTDERIDADLARLRAEKKDLDQENEALEAANDKLREEQTRLRVLLRSHGIDPDSPAQVL